MKLYPLLMLNRLTNPLISFFIVTTIFEGKFSEKKVRDNS